MSVPDASWVILTMGDRPSELAASVESIRRQDGVNKEILVVGNGVDVSPPPGAGALALPENVGIPAGRNIGASHTTADIVFFLDDDARYPDPDLAARVLAAFEAEPDLGIVTLRIRDPISGTTERRHVPRLGSGDPERSSDVTSFLGGACAVRRRVFEDVGGFPDAFFYAHEEMDLAWRAIDAGWRIAYRADLVVEHPVAAPQRHPGYHAASARNRVWVVRRRLPWLLAAIHLAVWVPVSLVRAGSAAARSEVLRGLREGFGGDPGPRIPMRWRTAFHMAALGRPPIV